MKEVNSPKRASELIKNADALLILAGAGMGVDSGLPTFRSDYGFWKSYPAFGSKKLSFADMANPSQFMKDPRTAWGFYGHRLGLYRKTKPHQGYYLIRKWAESLGKDLFVVTTNVDGQFQKAGYADDQIRELHGSIHWMQCHYCEGIWRADRYTPIINKKLCQWEGKLPTCPSCGGVARPNILMFDDLSWNSTRSDKQKSAYMDWKKRHSNPLAIEIGAGSSIPTLKKMGLNHMQSTGPLIRINLEDTYGVFMYRYPNEFFKMGALSALELINRSMGMTSQ